MFAVLSASGCSAYSYEPRSHVLLILADDMGSDLGSLGWERTTPNIDAIAANKVRCASFITLCGEYYPRVDVIRSLSP